jgi:hypothetical protein
MFANMVGGEVCEINAMTLQEVCLL